MCVCDEICETDQNCKAQGSAEQRSPAQPQMQAEEPDQEHNKGPEEPIVSRNPEDDAGSINNPSLGRVWFVQTTLEQPRLREDQPSWQSSRCSRMFLLIIHDVPSTVARWRLMSGFSEELWSQLFA